MGSLTNFVENAMMDHVFNKVSFACPTSWYLALLTADPGDGVTGGSAYEVPDASNYTRQLVSLAEGDNRAAVSNTSIEFLEATGSWGTVTHWMITDDSAYGSGNALAYGSFQDAKTVTTGDILAVFAGEISVSFLAGGCSTYMANKILNHVFVRGEFTMVDTYIGLGTAALNDASGVGNAAEPTGLSGYARKFVQYYDVASLFPYWAMSSSGMVRNAASAVFNAAGEDWGTVESIFIADSATPGTGELLMYDNTVSIPVKTGDTVMLDENTSQWTLS